jgi:peroxiredoxin
VTKQSDIKTSSFFVLISMLVLNFGWAGALRPEQTQTAKVRIVASLEEAAVRSPGPAVLVFFSLDCPVCWEELFEVRYMVEKHSIPIALVGISADSHEDLEPFLAKHAFFYPVVCDQARKLFRRFKVRLEPFIVVLDGERVIHQDNTAEPMDMRREKLKRCLLEITAKRPS